ncbi:hypothetical protein GJ496_002052 [Pomphorhynchus laevis]|nr:hypothetical protein GJ496_002052 [Pomphorhynchus laevis]
MDTPPNGRPRLPNDAGILKVYSASLFKYCFPSLQNSSKISLRIDCHGVLCMHSLMQFTNNRVAFTEFLLRPQISPNQHVSITNE